MLLSQVSKRLTMGSFTEVERERWKKIRRRVYLPEDVDEYNSSSSVLNGTRAPR